MKDEIKKTIDYYNKNAQNLISIYLSADTHNLHAFIKKYLHINSKVLDVGFGAGREIEFFLDQKCEVWGVDASEQFIKIAKRRFPNIKYRFFHGTLPSLSLEKKFENYFDMIVLIAVWMHIPKKYYNLAIKNLKKLIKHNGIIIMSYSITERDEKDRFFETIDPDTIEKSFKNAGFQKIDEIETKDGSPLKRDIIWKTEAYRNEK